LEETLIVWRRKSLGRTPMYGGKIGSGSLGGIIIGEAFYDGMAGGALKRQFYLRGKTDEIGYSEI